MLYSLIGRTGFCLAPSISNGLGLGDAMSQANIELLQSVESMTDDRARDEIGRIDTVRPSERLYGDDNAAVMAGFAHWDWSRGAFSDGTYPVFFFALDPVAAIEAFGQKLSSFFSATNQEALKNTVCASLYALTLSKEVVDCRGVPFDNEYGLQEDAYGAIFSDPNGSEAVASFRAGLISACRRVGEIQFSWNGSKTSWVEVV
jgi:hypothetical protein